MASIRKELKTFAHDLSHAHSRDGQMTTHKALLAALTALGLTAVTFEAAIKIDECFRPHNNMTKSQPATAKDFSIK